MKLSIKEYHYYCAEVLRNIVLLIVCGLFLSGCAGTNPSTFSGQGTPSPVRATSRPYQINGVWYYPQQHYEYEATGIASHYGDGDGFHGRPTATGEKFDTNDLTGAHKTLPLPCIVRVTNLENGRSLKLRMTDRGPFVGERLIDVSKRAAQLLGFHEKGLAKVHVKTLVTESLALNQNPALRPSIMLASASIPPHKRQKRSSLPPRALPAPVMLARATLPYQPRIQPAAYRPTRPPLKVRSPLPFSRSTLIQPAVVTTATEQPFKALGPRAQSAVYISAGNFKQFSDADHLSRTLQKSLPGVKVRLIPPSSQRAPLFSVMIGPFRSSDEAQHVLKKIALTSPRLRLIHD